MVALAAIYDAIIDAFLLACNRTDGGKSCTSLLDVPLTTILYSVRLTDQMN